MADGRGSDEGGGGLWGPRRRKRPLRRGVPDHPFFEYDERSASFHALYQLSAAERFRRPESIDFEVVDPGDSIAVMLYVDDEPNSEVIVFERFRAGAVLSDPNPDNDPATRELDPAHTGRLRETVAARVPKGFEDRLEEAAQSLIYRKTGYDLPLSAFEPIATLFPSPGYSAERVHLFFAASMRRQIDLSAPQRAARPEASAENLQVRAIPLVEFLIWLEEQEINGFAVDAKLMLGAQQLRWWLAQERRGLHEFDEEPAPAEAIAPDDGLGPDAPVFDEAEAVGDLIDAPASADRYQSAAAWEAPRAPISRPRSYDFGDKLPRIHLHFGDVADVRGVDIWVNSENTNFEMDQRLGRSISGRIRSLGAHLGEDGRPLEDTIWIDLLRQRGENMAGFRPGHVLETTAGGLRRSNGVSRLLHVAAVEASDYGVRSARLIDVQACVRNSLRRAVSGVAWPRFIGLRLAAIHGRSILFPLIGAGNGDRSAREVFEVMLVCVYTYFEREPDALARISDVHFVTFRRSEHAAVLHVLEAEKQAFDLERAQQRARQGGDDAAELRPSQ